MPFGALCMNVMMFARVKRQQSTHQRISECTRAAAAAHMPNFGQKQSRAEIRKP